MMEAGAAAPLEPRQAVRPLAELPEDGGHAHGKMKVARLLVYRGLEKNVDARHLLPSLLKKCSNTVTALCAVWVRALGWPVETIEIPSPTEHSPDRIIALYRLDGKYTAQALAMNGGAV